MSKTKENDNIKFTISKNRENSNMKNFTAGKYKQQREYRSFTPSFVNCHLLFGVETPAFRQGRKRHPLCIYDLCLSQYSDILILCEPINTRYATIGKINVWGICLMILPMFIITFLLEKRYYGIYGKYAGRYRLQPHLTKLLIGHGFPAIHLMP